MLILSFHEDLHILALINRSHHFIKVIVHWFSSRKKITPVFQAHSSTHIQEIHKESRTHEA